MKKVAEILNILTMNPQEKDLYYTYLKESLTQRDDIVSVEAKWEAQGIEIGKDQLLLEVVKGMLRNY